MATPYLDRAVADELTSSEIELALRELEALNGADSRAGLEVRHLTGFRARVIWCTSGSRNGEWRLSIEAALLAERAEIERCIAETAGQS